MNVTAPAGADGLLLRAPFGDDGLLRPRGARHARDDVRADRVPPGRLPDRPQGRHPSLRAGPGAAVLLDVRVVRRRSREVGVAHHRTLPHPQPQRLPLPALARHAQRGRTLRDRLQGRRGLHAARAPHAPLRRHRLARRLSALQVRRRGRPPAGGRSLARAAVRSHDLQAAGLLSLRVHRALGREGRHVAALLPQNLDYLETLGYHFGDFFSGGGVVGRGMVTLHPVGLPHGPKPRALQAFMDGANRRRAQRGRPSWPTSPIPPRSRSGRWG